MSIHPEYELLREEAVTEYRARGLWLRHRKTGCEVFHLLDDSEENTFAFIFRTPSRNSTGVAHIIEHSVLCGSERYPVKDPFLSMARRSLQTYLNALTYADKTVYPAASLVEVDYWNLMDVYGDAVFFPRLDEDAFLQEAQHLEYDGEGRLGRRGVVYNEMKGDYSSAESVIGTKAQETLFSPGHPYAFDSGGDPDVIPELDYAAFKEFHRRHYHPSNCRIFLHGRIDTARQLSVLHERFLSRFEAAPVDSAIPLQPRFAEPLIREFPYEAEGESDARASTLVSWLIGDTTRPEDALALQLLGEVLTGNDGAPLSKALRDSRLGEDVSPHTGADSGLRQTIFAAGLRGVERGDAERIEALILDELKRIEREGIPRAELEAAFHAATFAGREIRRGGGTIGLRYLSRAARGWLHGGTPFDTLSFDAPLAILRSRLAAEPRYFERLIREALIDNPHRVRLTVYPEAGLAERRRADEEKAFQALDESLGEAGRAAVRARAKALAERQNRADSPEDLASLPRLSRSDIPRDIERVERVAAALGSVRASLHPLFANGVVYADLAFPLDSVPLGRAAELPLFARFISGAGTSALGWDRVQRELAGCAGGFQAALLSSTPVGAGPERHSSWLVFRLKALKEKFGAALDLVMALLSDADYRDGSRLRDILVELRNDAASSVIPAGNAFAAARSSARFSASQRREELWHGPSQILALRDLALRCRADEDGEPGEPFRALGAELHGFADALLSREGLRVNLTTDPEGLDEAWSLLGAALLRLPEKPAAPLATSGDPEGPARREAWTVGARVGFTGLSLPASRFPERTYAHEQVLAHLLSTSFLWDEVRVRRGAYGAHCSADGSEGLVSFGSYRDPEPLASFESFRASLRWALERPLGEEAAEEAVIGATGRDLRPMTPEEKGLADFRRELFGIVDEDRAAKRLALLETRSQDLRAAAERLLAAWDERSDVLISSGDDVESMLRSYPDTVARDLPT